MVSIGENNNARNDEDLERQRCENTNQEEAGDYSGIFSCNLWMCEISRKEED